MNTNSSTRRSSTVKKYKAACDQCHNSKVKCSGGGPPCKRCADARLHCHYSLAARIGKPPGSKNRKTLERLNNASTSLSKIGSAAENNQINIDECSIAKGGGPTKDQETEWHDSVPLNLFHLPELPDAQSISPSIDCFDFLASLQPPGSAVQEYQGISSTIQPEKDRGHADYSTALSISDVGSPGEAESIVSWTESMESCPSLCSTHIMPQACLDLAGTSPRTNSFQPDAAAALENVAACLTAALSSQSSQDAQSQPLLCSCLHSYAHVLCQLQTIEKRQSPVQADTLLTCIKLALSTTEDHPKCKYCCFDSRVLVQIIMIFQTIFNWAQSQFRASADFSTVPAMFLGRHELTKDEVNFVKGALVARALKGIISALEGIASRNEYAASNIQKRRPSSSSSLSDGEDYEDLQRLVNSLTRRYHALSQKMMP